MSGPRFADNKEVFLVVRILIRPSRKDGLEQELLRVVRECGGAMTMQTEPVDPEQNPTRDFDRTDEPRQPGRLKPVTAMRIFHSCDDDDRR